MEEKNYSQGKFCLIEDGAHIGKNVILGDFSIVRCGAVIGEGTKIGSHCEIGAGVVIGKNNKIASQVVITGKTQIGNDNEILPFVSIGCRGKDAANADDEGEIIIGNGNYFGQMSSVDCGINDEELGNITRIGNRCYLMNGVAIAHNCQIGVGPLPDNPNGKFDTIICPMVQCCGGSIIGKGSEISTHVTICQFREIGVGVFIGANCCVRHNIPPFARYDDNHIQNIYEKALRRFLKIEDENALTEIRMCLKRLVQEDDYEYKAEIVRMALQGHYSCHQSTEALKLLLNYLLMPRLKQSLVRWKNA